MNTDSIQLVINTIGTALSKYGPAALDTMLKVVRYQGLGAAILGVSLWLTSIPVVIFGYKAWKAGDKSSYASEGWQMLSCMFFAAFVILHVIAGRLLFDIWTWVAIFDPKIALAHQILTQIGTKQ